MSRDIILPTIGVLDWLLKDGGFLYVTSVRHFHSGTPIITVKRKKYITSSKVGGIKIFPTSGKYLEVSSEIYNTTEFQLVQTSKPD